jgi:ABC-type sugar transport system, periplasmic component
MKRKLLSLILTVMMVASLAACGEKAATKTSSDTTQPTEAAKSETASPEASKASDGDSANTGKDLKDTKVELLLPTLQSEFFVGVGDATKAYLGKAGITDVSIESYDSNAAKAIEAIENCITEKVDVLVAMTMDASTDDAIKEAMEAGIVVIAAGVAPAEYNYLLVADNKDAGGKIAEMAADWVNEHFNGETQIAVISSTANSNMAERSNGMVDKLKELLPKSEIVMNGAVNGSVGEGTQFAENLLQKYPDCQVVVTYSDQMAVEAVEVFKAAGKAGKDTAIFGNDATGQALKEISDGDIIRGTIYMGDLGEMMGGAIVDYMNGKVEKGSILVGENIKVTSANVKDYIK